MEGKETVFTPSLEGMKNVKSELGEMLTKPFLDARKFILPVINKFGAALTLVKSDIGGNISRLEDKYLSDPAKYKHLHTMVQEEVEAKTAKGSSSCANGCHEACSRQEEVMEAIAGAGDVGADMKQFCATLSPFLEENHKFLASVGLDDMEASQWNSFSKCLAVGFLSFLFLRQGF